MSTSNQRPGVVARVENVDAKKARDWLDAAPRNRHVRRNWVLELAVYMKTGQYFLTHQGICFDSDGRLRDGQHRLLAIIEADVSIPLLIVRGVDPKSMRVFDSGKMRSVTDAMNVEGLDVNNRLVAIGRRMMVADETNVSPSERPSRLEIMAFVMKHRKAITFSMNHPGDNSRFVHASLRAPIARAWYKQDRTRLNEFMTALATGIIQRPDDAAVITLRNFYMERLGSWGSGGNSGQLYHRAEAMLQAFLDHETPGRIRSAREELFPLPGEKPGQALTDQPRGGDAHAAAP
jgi:hypothetical protein